MKKTTLLILGVTVLIIILVLGYIFIFQQKTGDKKQPSAQSNAAVKTNANTAIDNTNQSDTNAINASLLNAANQAFDGTVFLKGYNTPSESYGILTTDGFEVGLGKYDSMKEQFRGYIGSKVHVTFSHVCKSTSGDCCLSLFGYCGTVASWEPLK